MARIAPLLVTWSVFCLSSSMFLYLYEHFFGFGPLSSSALRSSVIALVVSPLLFLSWVCFCAAICRRVRMLIWSGSILFCVVLLAHSCPHAPLRIREYQLHSIMPITYDNVFAGCWFAKEWQAFV